MASLITAFTYKKKLKFDTDTIGVDTNQANFPVCVHINTSSWATSTERDAFFAAWNVGGKRCQFFDADGTTNLDYEVELYASATPEAIYWVRVPQVLGNSTADYVWVAFGNDPNGTDQDNHEGVWDSSFKLANHMNYLPVFAQATDLGDVGEVSLIMDGSQCDAWFGGGTNYETLYYAYATDSDLNDYSTPQVCTIDSNIRHPFVLKEGSTYYLFTHRKIGGVITNDIYLYSSTNKTTWSILNSGNPVLNDADSGIYKYIWNVSVVVIDSTWHMFIECASENDISYFGCAYSYSTIGDMNWDTHRTATHIIDDAGNSHAVYVPDRNAIMLLLWCQNSLYTTYWDIYAYSASTSSDLSLAASWTRCRNFKIAYPSMHTADPHLVVAGDAFDYNLVIVFMYNQNSQYEAYIDLSLDEFYDRIHDPIDSTSNKNDGVKRGTFEPAQIAGQVAGGQDFDGTNDITILTDNIQLTSAATIEAWVKFDTLPAATCAMVSKRQVSPAYNDWQFYVDNANTYITLWGLTTASLIVSHATSGITTGAWFHIVARYDGSTIKFYVNGVEKGTVNTSGTINNHDIDTRLGDDWYAHYLNGIMDEVRISNAGRSADWIKLEYYSMKKTNFNGDSWISWDPAEAIFQPFRGYYPHLLAH